AGTPTCWVLASLAAAANQGENLAGRIEYLGGDDYRVKLFQADLFGIQAKLIDVKFDGTVSNLDAQPHAHGQEGDFWGLLMHRAFAKMQGKTLEQMTVGFPNTALTAFTGRAADSRTKVGDWFEGMDTPLGRIPG